MKHLLSGVIPYAGAYSETYFAGANTSRGFRSAYPEMIKETDMARVYILKGGSGTGKSSLMRKCAAQAQAAGMRITMLLCSSDHTSADAVILQSGRGSVAILDGTSPHTVDPALPGAVGCIVNLGQFWRTQDLAAARTEIARHTEGKMNAYALAYRYLSAYGEVSEAARALLRPCLLQEKMDAAAVRLLQNIPRSAQYSEEIRYTTSVSMHGLYHLETWKNSAQTEVFVSDVYGSGAFFLDALRSAASLRRCPLYYAPAVGECSALQEVYFGAAQLSVCLTDGDRADAADADGERVRSVVNMHRFLDKRALAACRGRLRFAERCREMLMDGATESLGRAREHHFALEEIYKSAMDFDAVTEASTQIAEEIVELLV